MSLPVLTLSLGKLLGLLPEILAGLFAGIDGVLSLFLAFEVL